MYVKEAVKNTEGVYRMKEKMFKPPKTLGACADRLYKLRLERAEAQKVADKIEEEEKALKEYIINTLPKSEASGVSGKVARVSVVVRIVPQVKDWSEFYKYVEKTKSFDLLQRRLSEKAVQERWDAGKRVAGVETFNVITVSVNKL